MYKPATLQSTYQYLIILLLFVTVAVPSQAQSLAEFFDHRAEERFLDSLEEEDSELSREEIRQATKEYRRQQADAYYRSYQQRVSQQKKIKRLPKALLQNQAVAQGVVTNSTVSEGQVPDSVEYAALKALYNATGGSNNYWGTNWLQGTTSSDFANWYGLEVENGDVVSISIYGMTGEIPARFCDLRQLQYAHLFTYEDGFTTIPAEFTNFANLKWLTISLHGSSIPEPILNLNELEDLAIYQYDWEGTTNFSFENSDLPNLKRLVIEAKLIDIQFGEEKLGVLEYLDLSSNLFISLPSSIIYLTNLKELNLEWNNLTNLPDWISNLTNLQRLDIDNNKILKLPINIDNLTSLQELDADDNQLSTLPTSFGNLNSLRWLDLEENKLSTLPTSFGNLSSLRWLDLEENQFNSLQDSFSSLRLDTLNLEENQFVSFPEELLDVTSLKKLDLGENQLTSIAKDISKLVNLKWLDLDSNQLDTIPTSIFNLPLLVFLDLEGNKLTHVPDLTGHPNISQFRLNLHNNQIDNNSIAHNLDGLDSYPFEYFYYREQAEVIGEAKTLYAATGANAILQAFFDHHPQSRYQWQRQQNGNWIPVGQETQDSVFVIPVVTIADSRQYRCRIINNWITDWDGIPFEQYSAPITLVVEEAPEEDPDTEALHAFVGTIGNLGNLPASWDTSQPINTWEGVSVINGRVAEITLKDKGLTGSVPESFNKLTELKKLNLSGNKLSGPIPESLSALTKLTDLNLTQNQLTGSIPVELGDLINLKNLRLGGNQLTGTVPSSLGNLSELNNLFLNNNQLTGSIPPSLGKLHQVERLNLGINQLSGEVPPEIGSMASLQYLYLQKNQLNGAIPDALGNLYQVKKLVAFNNQFEGRIPETFLRLQNLEELQLYRNQFTYAPDFSSLQQLNRLDLRHNYLTFSSLLYNRSVDGFRYAPQRKIGPPRIVDWNDCSNASIDLGFDAGINNSLFQWKRNNQNFRTGSSPFLDLSLQNLLKNNLAGNYTATITNPLLPDLTLSTERITLNYDRNIQLANCPVEPHNYVKVETVLKDGRKNESSLSSLSNTDLNVHYDYIDGIGRTIQQVDQAASPAGHDVVQPIVYDALGRVSKAYLPYVTNNTSGDYRTDAIAQVTDFYAINNDQIANTSFPYAETIYEASPLGRVTEQGAVGNAWQPTTPGNANNKTIKTAHRTNTANEVRRWQINNSGLRTNQFYQPGQLYVQETKDELNRAVLSFQDKRGMTLFKKVESDDGWLETYYIHDDFGNLRFVVPPKASASLGTSGYNSFFFDDPFILDGCYQYEYDARQRMISQQVPGAEPVWMVYDRGDRLVLTQDGNQRTNKQWSFIKYDPLNRPILTGLLTTNGTLSREQMQNNVADQHTTERYRGQQSGASFGYSNTSYPKSTDGTVAVLTATFYDNYDFVRDLHSGNSYEFVDVSGTDPAADYPDAYFPRVQGQVTGTQVRVLGNNDWRWEAVYYDDDYRVIQTIGSHYPLGADRYTTRYDDAGRPTHTLRQHDGYAGSHAVETVHHRYTYDHAGRPTAVYHRINNEAEVQLAANTYNELGELIKQDLHRYQDNGYLQSVDYRYNERGWLTAINRTEEDETDDLFQLRLSYNDGPAPQYNGSITSALWVNQTRPLVKQEYEYTYDKVDRLANANYHNYDQPGGQSYDVSGSTSGNPIRYDASGNIQSLTRYGQQDTKIDELAYDYGSGVGNQLQSVTDGGDAQGFTAGDGGLDDDYYYDANGNLTDDYHKDITVRYNHLNLPERIDFTASGAQIRYTYDAAGTRLMKEVDFDGVNQQTLYMAGIEYYSPNWQNTPESSLRQVSYLRTDYGRVYPYFPLDTDPCATLSSQTTNEGRRWVYHYDLTDHLGNVRTTVASERTTDRYVATMESEVADNEALMFRGLDSRHPDVKYNTTAACDAIDTPNESAHLRIASEMDQRVFGPAKSLAVQPGDKIRLSVQAQYVPSSASQTYSANLATLFLSAFTGGGPGAIESGSAAYQGLSEALGAGALLGRDDGDVPRAYLRYILFDKHYQPVANFNDQNSMRLSAAGANAAEQLASGEISIDQPGYLYVYVSNESNWQTDVFFDDLVIEHDRGTVVQSQDFYPFGGLHQPAISYQSKYLYNGVEYQNELGLNVYATEFRMLDPYLGSWWQIDPEAEQFYGWSPYNSNLNNPVRYKDPSGRCPDCPTFGYEGQVVSPNGVNYTYTGGSWIRDGGMLSGVTVTGNRGRVINYYGNRSYDEVMAALSHSEQYLNELSAMYSGVYVGLAAPASAVLMPLMLEGGGQAALSERLLSGTSDFGFQVGGNMAFGMSLTESVQNVNLISTSLAVLNPSTSYMNIARNSMLSSTMQLNIQNGFTTAAGFDVIGFNMATSLGLGYIGNNIRPLFRNIAATELNWARNYMNNMATHQLGYTHPAFTGTVSRYYFFKSAYTQGSVSGVNSVFNNYLNNTYGSKR